MLVDQLLHVILQARAFSRQLPTLTENLLSLLYTVHRVVLKAKGHREGGGRVAEGAEQAGGCHAEDLSCLLYTGHRVVLKAKWHREGAETKGESAGRWMELLYTGPEGGRAHGGGQRQGPERAGGTNAKGDRAMGWALGLPAGTRRREGGN